jgi:predicted dehydrogenase
METLRLGIIGLGNMGSAHSRWLLEGKVARTNLAAVCDVNPAKLEKLPAEVKRFTDHKEMLKSGEIDAVLIATPHYFHTTQGIDALEAGLHVLVEKPISVHKADCQRLIAAHKNPKQVFAAMFNQRTDHFYRKIRGLITSGELGEIRRIQWTITNWFRTEAYYASGGWRATWSGEGGGVLLNQCPHNIDLFWWMFGMPSRVRAFCALGKYHKIEVEDDVTAYFEYPNGATATFITSTGESPGTNRLEIVGERGKVIYENDSIRYTRNEIPMSEFSRTTDQAFATPGTWKVEIPAAGHGDQHIGILNNFAAAVLDGIDLIAPAAEGIHSVELANAMLYSSMTNATVELPLDAAAYEKHLMVLIEESKKRAPKQVREVKADMGASYR